MKILSVDIRCHEILNEVYCEPRRGVEIGVWQADLSWRLLAANRNLYLYMVDPWREAERGGSYTQTDDHIAHYTQYQHDAAMEIALRQVAPFRDQCEVMRMTSEEASTRFADESLDFVFIDGDHSYEGCKLDIDLWWPKVKPGGLLCGHDYRDEMRFGVIPAVQEFVERVNGDLRTRGNHTWFVTK